MSSSKSRKLKQNRKYHRTQVTITWGSNLRFQNNGGRQELMALSYQIRSRNTSALGDRTHEQHDELRDWVGDDYDPDVFSIEHVNRELTPLRRRQGKPLRGWAPAR